MESLVSISTYDQSENFERKAYLRNMNMKDLSYEICSSDELSSQGSHSNTEDSGGAGGQIILPCWDIILCIIQQCILVSIDVYNHSFQDNYIPW